MVKPLRVGVLLSRIPIVTPEPVPFMRAYYRYMSELEKRLMWTFNSSFYFKKGSLAERRFLDQQKAPLSHDENAIFPDGAPDLLHNRDRRFKQEIRLAPDAQEKVREQPRVTAADTRKDLKSLERKLDQTLYLLINTPGKGWQIPSFDVADQAPSLHHAADVGLRTLGGEGMNIWTVSPTPAAVLEVGDKPQFVIRQHILQGQFQPTQNVDYAWLAKSEIAERTSPEYYELIDVLL